MKWISALTMAVALCAGCQSPAPMNDPFLGRTTVPPPGTAMQPPAPPYYGAPAGASTAPPLMAPPTSSAPAVIPRPIGPTNFAPAPAGSSGLSSSFTPNVSPVTPAGSQPNNLPGAYGAPLVTPVSSQPKPSYGPPGGFAYPQAYAPPGGIAPAAAQAGVPKPLDVDRIVGATPTPTPAASGVVPASHWEPAGSSAAAAQSGTPSATALTPSSSGSIRIVEPNNSSSTLNQSLTSARAPELAQLPPAGTTNSSTFAPRAAMPTPAASTGITPDRTPTPAATGDLSRSSYGNDPQYRLLKGKLEYSESTHTWRLRYSPPEGATDNFGGSVILPDASKLAGLNPGDFVTVQGSVGQVSTGQGSFAPQYKLERVQKQ